AARASRPPSARAAAAPRPCALGREERCVKEIWEQAIAEVIGTFALVFIGAGSGVIPGGPPNATGLWGLALAHGLGLAIMISNLGHISGGHFNPAVTISTWVAGKIETIRAGWYITAQLFGAVLGALLLRASIP